MAEGYVITGQKKVTEQRSDGTYKPVIEVGYQTTGEPMVVGSVTVPAHLLKDKVAYVEAVKEAVEAEVASHNAVAGL